MNSLLPCPFCGKTAKEPADILGTCLVYCSSCVAHSPIRNTIPAAVTAWNTRFQRGKKTVMPADTRLRHCPFCGQNPTPATLVCIGNSRTDRFAIHCCYCDSYGPFKDTQELAIQHWNQRHKQPQKPA